MKVSEFRKLIREEVRKVVRESKSTNTKKRRLKEEVSISELENMKATVGYIANDEVTFDLMDEWDEMTAEDAEIVSFEEGSKEVLKYAKDYGADASEIKQMVVKLEKLKTMGTKFVLYAVESDLNLGVL